MNRSILESVYTLPSSSARHQLLMLSVYNFSSGAAEAAVENTQTTSTGITTKTVIAELLPVLPKPALPPVPLSFDGEVLRPRSTWQRLSDKYSLSGQQTKIQRGETFFQAARRQASDP